jgi:hypothetical protein
LSGLDEQFPICGCDYFYGWRIYDKVDFRGRMLLGWILADKSKQRERKGHGIVHLHEMFFDVRETQQAQTIIDKIKMVKCHTCEHKMQGVRIIRLIGNYIKLYWDTSRSYRGASTKRYIMIHDEE